MAVYVVVFLLGNFGRRTPSFVPAAADDSGSSTESTELSEETSVDKSISVPVSIKLLV